MGLVQWSGTQYQYTVAGAVGGSVSEFDLKSECIDGQYAYVHVMASAVVLGYGAEATGGGSPVTFNDANIAIDPNVFNGNYRYFSGGLGIGPVANYGYTQLGQAFSTPSVADTLANPGLGFDASLTASLYGRSATLSSEFKTCTCPKSSASPAPTASNNPWPHPWTQSDFLYGYQF